MSIAKTSNTGFAAFLAKEKEVNEKKVLTIALVIAIFQLVSGLLRIKKTILCKRNDITDPEEKPCVLVATGGILTLIELIWRITKK